MAEVEEVGGAPETRMSTWKSAFLSGGLFPGWEFTEMGYEILWVGLFAIPLLHYYHSVIYISVYAHDKNHFEFIRTPIYDCLQWYVPTHDVGCRKSEARLHYSDSVSFSPAPFIPHGLVEEWVSKRSKIRHVCHVKNFPDERQRL